MIFFIVGMAVGLTAAAIILLWLGYSFAKSISW